MYPWAFYNSNRKLVGFDMDMAAELASSMNLDLQFLVSDPEEGVWEKFLNNGHCDIVMSGVGITPQRAMQVAFSIPYLDATWAFVVKDYQKKQFNTIKALRKKKTLKIAIVNDPYFFNMARRFAPQATIVPTNYPKYPEAFFANENPEYDAYLLTAEAGSAWCLLYPEYTVAVPHPDVVSFPMGYAVARGNQELLDFLNAWIELKKDDKTIQQFYDYWILGKGTKKEKPRWSLWKDVIRSGKN